MKQFIAFIIFSTLLAIINNRIVTTKDKWVNDLITLAKSKSEYRNKWPYNVLYYDGYKWYGDCVNIMKALFNGRDINNKKKDSYQHNLSNTGDITCYGMIQACTEVSSNFNLLKAGEPRILWMEEHIGAYLGKEIKLGKGIANVVECTGAWERGILFSYVDRDGTRRYAKGNGSVRGRWLKHGKPSKWVQY